MIRLSLIEQMVFEQRLDRRDDGVNYMDIWGKSVPNRKNMLGIFQEQQGTWNGVSKELNSRKGGQKGNSEIKSCSVLQTTIGFGLLLPIE